MITVPAPLFWLTKLYAWTFSGFAIGLAVKKLYRRITE